MYVVATTLAIMSILVMHDTITIINEYALVIVANHSNSTMYYSTIVDSSRP
jgi:hypothetical protein